MNGAATVLDTATLRKVGGRLGSTPAGVCEDDAGRRYYVKYLESVELARNEWLAAQLYRLAGAPTLHYLRTKAPDQIATEFVSLDKKHVAQLDETERRQARRWLGVHAWLANWDAAGFDGDNQGVHDGVVLTLDVGGALAFRAQGDPKGKAFGSQVQEIDTLRKNPGNPHAQALFAGISEAGLRQAIEVVVRITDADIRRVVADNGGKRALADRLIARKADMARRLTEDGDAAGLAPCRP
jgi:hypothetical protein